MSDKTGRTLILIAAMCSVALTGCDNALQKIGIQTSAAKAAQAEADSRAVGGACRQSGRAIEDCYSIYSWLLKTYIYEGWRDMDSYMRENNLDTVAPQLPPISPPPPPPPPPEPAQSRRKKGSARAKQAAQATVAEESKAAAAPAASSATESK